MNKALHWGALFIRAILPSAEMVQELAHAPLPCTRPTDASAASYAVARVLADRNISGKLDASKTATFSIRATGYSWVLNYRVFQHEFWLGERNQTQTYGHEKAHSRQRSIDLSCNSPTSEFSTIVR